MAELRAQVEAAYGPLGLPSWADPHPDRTPLDDEYSRVTDAARYVIVHARARLWAQVLEQALGARVEPVPPMPDVPGTADRRDVVDRGVVLTSPTPGTLPLLLLERDVPSDSGDVPLAVLHVAVVRPDVVVESQPDCGCDACDSGSSDLLEAVDRAVSSVVGGPFVTLRGAGWRAQWHPDGGSAGSDGARTHDFRELMELCRRLADGERPELPRGTEAFVGGSWLA